MSKTELLAGIAAMQRIQAANPPTSDKWQRASVALHKMATLLNGGVAPKPCKFTFDDSPQFDGFAHGSTWNGFDNVAVTRAELGRVVAWFEREFPGDEDVAVSNRDMLAIEPMANGLISLGWGYATQIMAGTNSSDHSEQK